MWKIVIALMKEENYYLLESYDLLPEEQKGCRKGIRGTDEQLIIDKHIYKETETRLIDQLQKNR